MQVHRLHDRLEQEEITHPYYSVGGLEIERPGCCACRPKGMTLEAIEFAAMARAQRIVVLMALMVVSGMRWISLRIRMCFPPLLSYDAASPKGMTFASWLSDSGR